MAKMVHGKIQSISELIKGTNSNYVKIFIDDVPLNFFINDMNTKTILSNLREGSEIEYELGENNGFQFIKSITQIIKPENHSINFNKPKEASPVGSASQNNDRVSS